LKQRLSGPERKLALRRKKWLGDRWRVSKKGNYWTMEGILHISTWGSFRGWGYSVGIAGTDECHFSPPVFGTCEEAKLAALDYIEGWERLVQANAAVGLLVMTLEANPA
jgi:hypothetical protein